MVDFFHDEAEYWRKVASNELMWDQKRKSTVASRRHTQKRVRLSQYLPDSSSSMDSRFDDETEEEVHDPVVAFTSRDMPSSLSPSSSPPSQEQNSTSCNK
jgi:hypothetical protein